jgi:predicted metal-dependent hydrolase
MSIQETIISGDTLISYDITFSRKRSTVVIVVHHSGRVEVKAPSWVPKSIIRDHVMKKSKWLLKKLAELDPFSGQPVQRTYTEGEPFLFLGKEYFLRLVHENNHPHVRIRERYLEVYIPGHIQEDMYTDFIRTRIAEWYRQQAIRVISEKIQVFSSLQKINPPGFRVKNIKKRWGSCSHRDQLNFNMKIVMAPIDQLEYVVMHEISHIRHKNHSSRFWEDLGKMMPDYQGRKERLKKNGWRYVL